MSRGGSSRGPGIRCPPPVYFLGAGVTAAALDWWIPMAIDGAGPGSVQAGIGWLLTAAGFGTAAWGIATLMRLRTTFFPDREASRLVVTGPYRYSRNPMYVGMTSVYSGVALITNSAWALLLLPFVLIFVATRVIGREERYLKRTFGEAYAEYCRRVRRWL
jgi:protein-S-isoprenylcysteine O-methyltransferase Ste14